MTQWILGIRPEYDGLRIDPVIPARWKGFTAAARRIPPAEQTKALIHFMGLLIKNEVHDSLGALELGRLANKSVRFTDSNNVFHYCTMAQSISLVFIEMFILVFLAFDT